jgi:hypothetical protein
MRLACPCLPLPSRCEICSSRRKTETAWNQDSLDAKERGKGDEIGKALKQKILA